MVRRLTFKHSYPVDADRLFAMAIDLDVLEAVSRPWLRFDHLPSGPAQVGQHIDVALSPLGVLPAQPYTMHVVTCDRAARLLRSEEHGMGITRLVHELQVEPAGTGALQVDRVEIDAGWRSGLVALWVRTLYRRRHRAMRQLLVPA
ncbi:SRPBCC family protein [Microbulbifer sp. S227A]|uniref:SRPBCC family protein n=1 Tax=Microbulbifer sp. S227A TaxID=3415131 RepID=UPI003C7DDBAF